MAGAARRCVRAEELGADLESGGADDRDAQPSRSADGRDAAETDVEPMERLDVDPLAGASPQLACATPVSA
jgi:hypothetical protein